MMGQRFILVDARGQVVGDTMGALVGESLSAQEIADFARPEGNPFQMSMAELRRYAELLPLLVILTDGAGNVSIGNMPPQIEAYHIAEQIAEADVKSIVVNMESPDYDKGLAQALADHLGGVCYNLASLHAESLLNMVRGELAA